MLDAHQGSKRTLLDRRLSSSPARRSLGDDVLRGLTLAPTSAAEALECLTTVSARLRAVGDARAVFPDIYSVVTRRVLESIRGQGRTVFFEPAFISRLAGRFCELYLAALRRSFEGELQPCAAWSVADRASSSDAVTPVQHALLGLNAHINFDLALGLFANVLALGGAGDQVKMDRYRHDHDAVNEILAEALPEVVALLADRYGCPIARRVLRLGAVRLRLYAATLFTLETWRTRVWRDLLELLAARHAADRARIEARMSLNSGLTARVLAIKVPAPLRRPPRSLLAAA
jgi:hypothetical protein